MPSLRHQNNLFWCGANMRLALKPLFLLLLALFFGMSSVKAQDYSGVYYLSGNNQGTNSYDVNNTTTNFYLCPTENWIYYQATDNFTTSNNGQPFLTTYQYRNGTNDYTKAIWVIKKHLTQNYYYIIHAKDGKYMTANGGISGSKSANRIRVHLEESNSPNGNMLFDIAYVTTISTSDPKNYTPYYDISPQNYSGWFLNITQGNRASLQGTSDKTDGPSYTLNGTTTRNVGGTIGLWNQGNDYTSKLYLENAKAALTPTISDINTTNNTFTITCDFVPTGCSIVYTTDGSDPSVDTSTTPATINGTEYSDPVTVTGSMIVKAAVIGYDMVLSNIDSKSLSPVIAAPTVTNNGDGTISLSTTTAGATIYYTTDGTDPDDTKTEYSSAFSLGDATIIKAIAYLGSESSEVTTYNVPQYDTPTISFNSATLQVTIDAGSGGTAYYNTGDGLQEAPTTSSTQYSAPFTVSSATTIKAIATHPGYLPSEVVSLAVSITVADPVVTNNGDGTISLSTTTPGASIYYTTDGGTPNNTSTPYTSPFSLGDATVIKAIAYLGSESSEVTTYNVPQYDAPTISFDNATSKVTITSGGTVYYNTGNGSQADPTISSTPYSAPFDVTSATTVKAIATHVGYFTSEVAILDIIKVATPTFTVNSDNSITITCSTTGASIYYTTDDTDPDANSTLYTDPVTLPNGTTIKVIAVKANCINSEIVSFTSLAPIMISYDAVNNKVVITNEPVGSTIYYTTGTTADDTPAPSESNGIEYNDGDTGFDLPDDVDYIRAIAIKGSDKTPEVNLAILVHTSTSAHDIPYYIQSVECTDFYMIPSDVSSGVTNIITSSLPSSAMQWCFIYAGKEGGVDYYYIKNKATNEYACYTSSSVCLHAAATFEGASDKNIYKFCLNEINTTNPCYYIHPKSNTTAGNGLFKKGGNDAANVLELKDATTATGDDINRVRWNFIRSTDATKPKVALPIKYWGEDGQYQYCKMRNNNTSNSYLAPQSNTVSLPIASTPTNANNKILWYFVLADNTDDWVTYYYIVNATTGEYLYFNGSVRSSNNNAFLMKEELGTDIQKYQFTLAKTVKDHYYILPRVLINLTKNNYSQAYWDGSSPLSTSANRADAKGKWDFVDVSDATVLCSPELTLDADGKVNMMSRTVGSTMSYKIDNSEYSDLGSNGIIATLLEGEVKTITTKVSIGSLSTEKTMKVVYKPATIEFAADQSIVYNGQTHAPVLSSVKYGETPELKDHCVVSSMDINAGPATAVITQKEGDADYLIYGTKAFTIEKSPLSIFANSKLVGYGDQITIPGDLTFSTLGLATIDEVTVNLSCSLGKEMGIYPITFSNLPNSDVKYTIKRQDGVTDASVNYKNITLIPSSLIIQEKSIGDGVYLADGITAEATTSSITVTRGSTPLESGEDYESTSETEGYYDDIVWTISGKGHYTGSAILAFMTSEFSQKGSEWIAGYVASHDWAIPDGSGIEAWIATSVDPLLNVVRVKSIDYLPAGVPVVLTANADKSSGFMVFPKSLETVGLTQFQKESNLLNVVDDESGLTVSNDAEKYVFHKGEFVLAFSGTMPRGMIYIDRPQSSSTNGAPLHIVKEGDVTGIIEIKGDNNRRIIDDIWYSLDGRKLSGKPMKKGLYINNGRKILVK